MKSFRLVVMQCVLAVCSVFSVVAQSFEQEVSSKFFDYVESSRNEKVFVQTDRDSYQPGDTMFLRGFLFNAVSNKQVDYSRYIYVEVVDRTGVLYWREKIAYNTQDSSFNGYFALADNLSQGEYFLRAYTYWMQDQGNDKFFSKRFYIINPFDHGISCNMDILNDRKGSRILKINFVNDQGERYQNIKFNYFIPGETPDSVVMTANTGYSGQTEIRINDPNSDHIWVAFSHDVPWSFERYFKLPSAKSDFDVQFFPEGGALIQGAKQRVAIKSIGRDGLAVKVDGYIENRAGKKECNVALNELGMGSFVIETSPNEKYTAVLTTDDGNTKRFLLPSAENSNVYAIQLVANGDNIVYNVLTSLDADLSDKYIFINSRGMPLGVYPVTQTMGKSLNFSTAPEGILNFTLIDKSGVVYSNRMWYHHSGKRESFALESGEFVNPRTERTVQLSLNDVQQADIAISVISDAHTKHLSTTTDVETYVELSSDLSGYVERPEYYFTNVNRAKVVALDNLLLTQGWSRFDVTDIITDNLNTNSPFYIERGQSISGVVKPYIVNKAKFIANAKIEIVGSDGSSYMTYTDSVGRFVYNDLAYEIGTRFVVEAMSNKDKSNVELTLDEPIFLNPTVNTPIGLCKSDVSFYDKYGVDYIFSTDGSRVQTLGEVRVGAMSLEAMKKEFWADFEEHDSRMNFMLGYTDVESYGYGPDGNPRYYQQLAWAVERGLRYYTPTGRAVPKPGESNKEFFYNGTIESIWGMDAEWIKRWKNIELSGRAMNGEAAKMVIGTLNDDALEYVQTRLNNQMKGLTSMQNMLDIVGIDVNNMSIPIEYNYNIQTVVPFAPQKQGEVHFYKPKYSVPLDKMINDPIDAKATRYWNHKAIVKSGEPFKFTFPTAADSHTYTVVVNGVDGEGNPISGVWTVEN
ncbi:MAG: hypothetical protein E7071_03455 [Bacteroidales bacterium]|nr:hypothetical protein [Bacteroidales bacterium]